jgi:carbon storage regulator
MLVLTRKEAQSIVIDGRIRITLMAIRGSQIRLGIEAPKEVPVMREELLDDGGEGPARGPSSPLRAAV